jgi:hypothetical protein
MNRQRQTQRGSQPPSIVAQQAQQQARGAGSGSRLRFSCGGWGFQHGRGFSGVCSASQTVGGGASIPSPAAAVR